MFGAVIEEIAMSVSATKLPKTSALWRHFQPGDFLDCYRASDVSPDMTLEGAVETAAAHMPGWVSFLMDLRNRMVGPLGLKAGRHGPQPKDTPPDAKVENLGQAHDMNYLAFKVRERYADELIMGEDDHHLNFRVSIYRDAAGWYIATWVHPNAWYGWLYLSLVLPFHKTIIRIWAGTLERVAHTS